MSLAEPQQCLLVTVVDEQIDEEVEGYRIARIDLQGRFQTSLILVAPVVAQTLCGHVSIARIAEAVEIFGAVLGDVEICQPREGVFDAIFFHELKKSNFVTLAQQEVADRPVTASDTSDKELSEAV